MIVDRAQLDRLTELYKSACEISEKRRLEIISLEDRIKKLEKIQSLLIADLLLKGVLKWKDLGKGGYLHTQGEGSGL